jgi:hypothetical protein
MSDPIFVERRHVLKDFGELSQESMQICTLTWDAEALARELHLSVDGILSYFQYAQNR